MLIVENDSYSLINNNTNSKKFNTSQLNSLILLHKQLATVDMLTMNIVFTGSLTESTRLFQFRWHHFVLACRTLTCVMYRLKF